MLPNRSARHICYTLDIASRYSPVSDPNDGPALNASNLLGGCRFLPQLKSFGSPESTRLSSLEAAASPNLEAMLSRINAENGGFLRLPGLPQLGMVHLTVIDKVVTSDPTLTVAADSFTCQVLLGHPASYSAAHMEMMGVGPHTSGAHDGSGVELRYDCCTLVRAHRWGFLVRCLCRQGAQQEYGTLLSASMSFPADRVCAVPSCRLQACLTSLEVLATVDVRLGIDPGALVGFERLRKVCGDCKGCRRCTAP